VHSELSSILRLWEHDCVVDSVRSQAADLKLAVERIDQSIAANSEETEALKIEQAKFAEQQATTQRELDRYIIRRDRSKELLKGGHSLDFGTVQKQLEQCSEKVDDLELALLQIMEDRDLCTSTIQEKEVERETLRVEREVAHARWVAVGTKLRSQLQEVWPVRQAAAAELTREQLVRYEDFRKRSTVPVARITGKTCAGCHVIVASHLKLEVGSGKRLHACRGCARWLLPPEEPDELDEEASDA